MKYNEMKFNANEVRTIYTVFNQMRKFGWEKSRLGSVTYKEMQMLMSKIRCDDYCKRNHIAFADMTDDDYENLALEEAREDGYAV